MRIVAGRFRAKNLAKSKNLKALRPTTDKNREALFNILNAGKFCKELNFNIINADVLDLCCGSGAVGFEALSRGAKSCVFIDNNSDHLDLVKKNAVILGAEDISKIYRYNAKKLPKNDSFFDFIFIDPPYAEDYLAIIKSLQDNLWIKKGSLIVVEFQTNNEPQNFICDGLKILDHRTYGKTSFVFLTVN